jgi:hypothetical protein
MRLVLSGALSFFVLVPPALAQLARLSGFPYIRFRVVPIAARPRRA